MTKSNLLSTLYKHSLTISYDSKSKIVIMSDCHRGDGEWADNFSKNQNLYFAALRYYYDYNYTYIELGDGDELWQNRNMEQIINMHSDVFWLLSKYYKENRFHMIYGNHDMVKHDPKYVEKHFGTYYDETCKKHLPLFPNLKVQESIILENKLNKNKLFLLHGHQCDFFNYQLWKCSRFLVRYLWKPLEILGVPDPTRAAKNNTLKNSIEIELSNWSKTNNTLLIAGHTHRPIFPKLGEPLYFNDGSCVHPRCITALEIENNQISLVKWTIKTRHNLSLFVDRVILEGPVSIDMFYDSIT